MQMMLELMDRVQTIASFCWADPTATLQRAAGYQLDFHLERTEDGRYITLVLWPSPSPS